jgi:hypothetical protein
MFQGVKEGTRVGLRERWCMCGAGGRRSGLVAGSVQQRPKIPAAAGAIGVRACHACPVCPWPH